MCTALSADLLKLGLLRHRTRLAGARARARASASGANLRPVLVWDRGSGIIRGNVRENGMPMEYYILIGIAHASYIRAIRYSSPS